MNPGYPPVVLILAMLIGVPVALLAPYFSFCGAFFLLLIADVPAYAFTRIPELGRYFNLFDLLMIICAIGAILSRRKNSGLVPPLIAVVVLATASFGMFVSWSNYGFTIDAGRWFKYMVHFPVMIALGALVFDDERRVYHLILLILCACLTQSIRQCVFFQEQLGRVPAATTQDIILARTIKFFSAGNIMIPVCCLLAIRRRTLAHYLALPTLGFGILALIFQQTKSAWIMQLFAVSGLFFLLVREGRARKITRIVLISVLIVFVACGSFELLLGHRISLLDIILKGRMTRFDSPYDPYGSTASRWNAIKVEFNAWLNGNWLWGNGIGYYAPVKWKLRQRYWGKLAFGHIGYVAYLANLGLIGFFIYGLYIPIQLFRKGRKLWRHGVSEAFVCLGMYAVAWSLSTIIRAAITSGIGARGYELGIIIGTVWTLTSAKSKLLFRRRSVVSQQTGRRAVCNFSNVD